MEVRLYNPIQPADAVKLNYRMHDKYLIADDFAYILGGRNTDDLFLGNYVDSYNEDNDILVYETAPGEGGSYMQLQEYFDRIWDLPCCTAYQNRGQGGDYLKEHYRELREQYPQAFLETEWETATLETNGIELCTNPMEPENKRPQLWSRLAEEMKQADDVLIITPYIICSEQMYRDLTDIGRESSRVDVIINAVECGSNPFGCTDYLNQKEAVQKTGVHIYECLGAQALHTKTILLEDSVSIVGSCNLDMRSVYLDTGNDAGHRQSGTERVPARAGGRPAGEKQACLPRRYRGERGGVSACGAESGKEDFLQGPARADYSDPAPALSLSAAKKERSIYSSPFSLFCGTIIL